MIKWRQISHPLSTINNPTTANPEETEGCSSWHIDSLSNRKGMLIGNTRYWQYHTKTYIEYILRKCMTISWHWDIFHITGPLWGESTGDTTKRKPYSNFMFSDQSIPLLKGQQCWGVSLLRRHHDTKSLVNRKSYLGQTYYETHLWGMYFGYIGGNDIKEN